jgi:peptidoglycan/LPS O-acetylase OafA/YrhL
MNAVANRTQSGFYIPSLDGIRAAAVLLVFAAHAGLNDRVPGNFGVTVFFFLSGYLITTLLRMEWDKSGRISLKDFYLRRALRILPPMYVVLGVASLLTALGFLDGYLDAGAVAAQVIHLSNFYIVANGWWDGRAPGTWIYWSLAVEEHFYLVFPLAYIWLHRHATRKQQMRALLGMCALVLAWRFLLVFALGAEKDRLYVASDTRVDSILFGCALAVYGNPVLDGVRGSDRWWKYVWLPLGVMGLLLSFLVRGFEFEQVFRYSLQGISLFPLFVVAISYPEWGPCRILNWRWVKFVGVLSYSFYLMHPTILWAVNQWTTWHPLLQAMTGLTITLMLSTCMYVGIEKPMARIRKRLSRIGVGPSRVGLPEAVAAPSTRNQPRAILHAAEGTSN